MPVSASVPGPDSDGRSRILGAFALERVPGSAIGAEALPQAQAGALAALVARDLTRHASDAARLQCALAAAHYDPVELLRPGFPLHAQLGDLAASAPGGAAGGARVVAFGSHAGALPPPLVPAAEYRDGPLRLMPFVLEGATADIHGTAALLESVLMEHGMAAADTALLAQDGFGLQVEHARYLTVLDLCAMTALQYEHAGLGPLWPVIEAALLAPGREAWVDAAPEPLLHHAEGETRLALFSPAGWRARHAPTEDDPARLRRGFQHFEARQRQWTSVLMAHGIAVTCVQADAADPRAAL